MKKLTTIQLSIATLLVGFLTSCSLPMQTSSDDYDSAPNAGAVYYGSPYYGASPNVIVVERDPYTGRYYQVPGAGYGSVYSNGYGVYGSSRRGYSRRDIDRDDRRDSKNNNDVYVAPRGSNNNRPQVQQPQQPVPPPRPVVTPPARRDEVRDAVLGKRKN